MSIAIQTIFQPLSLYILPRRPPRTQKSCHSSGSRYPDCLSRIYFGGKLYAMAEKFISEQILPVAGTFDTAPMAKGAPALPGRFRWRDNEYTVTEVIKAWKESGPDKYPSGQMYLRKHWFEVRTTDGTIMTIYFERQARSKHDAKKRW